MKSLLVLLILFAGMTATLSAQSIKPLAINSEKFIQDAEGKWLWGGENDTLHFDISNCALKDDQFHYGIGREAFPALIKPVFITIEAAEEMFQESDRFLVVIIDGITKAYSIKDLIRHEVVNDEINGRPIMAAYCILADLGAMYERKIGDLEFTFALSGYTYFDPEVWGGLDGFVLWDRETESLWWPLIGKAVSGSLKDVELPLMDDSKWKQTTWSDILENHQDAQILQPDQDFERPKSWSRYEQIEITPTGKPVIAPKWGEKKSLKSSDQN